jgi:GxxExxY protein
VPLPVTYKSLQLDCEYRIDFLVEKTVVLELKAVEGLQPIHEAQLLTYLKLGMANRVGHQFQRACAQERHQANGA